jgi:hypothetical protein
VAYALFGALTVHALRRRSAVTEGEAPDTWYEVVGLPLLFLGCAVLIRDRFETPEGAAIAAAWAAFTVVFMALDGASHRARHLAVVLTAVMIGSGALLHHDDLARMVAFAVVAVAGVFTLSRVRGAALLLPIGLSLALGTLVAIREYERRESWTYMPFLNEVALAAVTVVVAYGVLSWLVPRALAAAVKDGAPRLSAEPLTAMRLLGPVAAFLWARQELVGAFSSDVATFLVITFYAVCGVGTILLGRARSVSALRQVGLVLSLYAAVKVVSEASGVDRIGLRVGSYLVVGGFLLGVGYLYRTALPPVDSES